MILTTCLLSEIVSIDFFCCFLDSRHPATWSLFGDSSWDSSHKKHERLQPCSFGGERAHASLQHEELRWSLLVGFPGDFELLRTFLCHSAADDTSEAYRYGYGKAGIVVTEATKNSKFNERSGTEFVYRLMVRHVSCCQAMY